MDYWLQITSGRGPAECQWVVGRVLELLRAEAEAAGLRLALLDASPGPDAGARGYLSVLLSLEGEAAEPFIASWCGTVQWIGKSPLRPQHRRRNWFVGVDSLQVPAAPRWSERELRFTTMRSSGPGGQHVNKTESAVRVVHLPTGLCAVAREERSQQQNRRLALARLAQLLKAQGERALQQSEQARWDQHNELVRGDAIRVYEGADFRRRS